MQKNRQSNIRFRNIRILNNMIMKMGDLYDHKGLKGVVISVDASGNHGLIMRLIKHKCQWYNGNSDVRTGARHHFDGKQNQDFILSRYGAYNYPAFPWCVSLGDGWYLPSIGELHTYANPKIL